MVTQRLRLDYPPSLMNKPVLNELIKKYDLTFNITQANVSLEEAWLDLEVSGLPEEINRARDWLSKKGIEVKILE